VKDLKLNPQRMETLMMCMDTAVKAFGLRAFQPDVMDLLGAIQEAGQPAAPEQSPTDKPE